jgi:hypothetical protein
MVKHKKFRAWIWPVLLVLLSVALYGKGVFDQDTFYPDADRIAMDGVYFHDPIRDMPLEVVRGKNIPE